jgi:hypothetical protein
LLTYQGVSGGQVPAHLLVHDPETVADFSDQITHRRNG